MPHPGSGVGVASPRASDCHGWHESLGWQELLRRRPAPHSGPDFEGLSPTGQWLRRLDAGIVGNGRRPGLEAGVRGPGWWVWWARYRRLEQFPQRAEQEPRLPGIADDTRKSRRGLAPVAAEIAWVPVVKQHDCASPKPAPETPANDLHARPLEITGAHFPAERDVAPGSQRPAHSGCLLPVRRAKHPWYPAGLVCDRLVRVSDFSSDVGRAL